MSPAHHERTGPDLGREVTVLCSVLGALEGRVAGILASAADLNVTRRCADVAELLGASASGLGMVAVVSVDLVGLDRATVAALHLDGVHVIGILDTTDSRQVERTAALGVDAVLDAGLVAETLVSSVRALAGATRVGSTGSAPWPGPGSPEDLDDGTWRRPVALGTAEDALPPGHPARRSRVVAVWGPTGAPGRSTIAFNVASELVAAATSRRSLLGGRSRASARGGSEPDDTGQTALLVDADTYAGSLAQVAGMLDESSGIAAACRAAAQGVLDPVVLARLAPEISPRLRVLSGISRASRWPEVSEVGLEAVWDTCREVADWTVVDCGFSVERDEMLSYDTRAPQRNGATLSALRAADVVVVVGGADPVGVHRLVRALDDLRECGAADHAERVVVVNRVRASATGPHPATALRDALLRYASVKDALHVPDDQATCDGALLAGRTLAEHAPTSGVRRAVRDVARRVRAVSAPGDLAPTAVATARARVGAARPVAH